MRYLFIIALQFLFIPSGHEKFTHEWNDNSEAYREISINRYFNENEVEIDVVSVGCFHYEVYKMLINQKGGKYLLDFYVKNNNCDRNNEFPEQMISHAKYVQTYELSSEKLNQLKQALIPDEKANSTSSTSWSIIQWKDTLQLGDNSGNGKLSAFIEELKNK